MDFSKNISQEEFKKIIAQDYYIISYSRHLSELCRKDVLNGKANFSINGDGKELPQVVLSKYFKHGDFRSGYYRDQTWMIANGIINAQNLFAQLYAFADKQHEPSCHGRQMNSHFSTAFVNENGEWKDLTKQYNSTCDIAPTASQMPRSIGLALASKLFRNNPDLHKYTHLSDQGNEVCFCTIGDASTSEGHFWEAVNAAGVIQIPLVIFVWDDGYGISVPTELQTAKGSISLALKGLEKKDNTNGIKIMNAKGWDYAGLHKTISDAVGLAREEHIPVVVHIDELTQPLGHSTSGSHERYKDEQRLEWEKEWDCNAQFKKWILANEILTEEGIKKIEEQAMSDVEKEQSAVYNILSDISSTINNDTINALNSVIQDQGDGNNSVALEKIKKDLEQHRTTTLHNAYKALRKAKYYSKANAFEKHLAKQYDLISNKLQKAYNTNLYFEKKGETIYDIQQTDAQYHNDSKLLNGYEILNAYFDKLFETNPLVLTFGEDVGMIGDVNQGFSGLQKKYGNNRIMDSGIRELSIMGQGIGLALRGFRPIAEIQYLDYIPYGLQPLIDDASTTHYRTNGQQICPLIVRTRGHRLVGIWHSGSPIGMVINAIRGCVLCVPRNMTQAVGLYNALLKIKDPSVMIECLNGYRLKEKLPSNLLEFTIPLGCPEVLTNGEDVTIVSYGSMIRIIQEAIEILNEKGIGCELIDVQTLLPFDTKHTIVESLKKTGRILFIDEDVPSGATAYMLQQVIEKQKGYLYLDAKPRTLTSKEHRPAYAEDGDYMSKPNVEDVIDTILDLISE